MQTILSRHSQLDILPETKLYAWQWHPTKSICSANADEKLREIKTLMPFVNRAWGLAENSNRMAGLKSSNPPTNGFADIGCIMSHVLANTTNTSSRVGEKSPLHIYHVDEILKKFPDAKILITRRDLRGAFHSQSMRSRRKKLSYRSFNLFNLVASWKIAMQLTQRYLSRYGNDRIHIVEFESLVQSPVDSLTAACTFLGIDFESTMLNVQFENSSFEDVQKIAGIDPQSANRWQQNLPAELKTRLDYLGREELSYTVAMTFQTLTQQFPIV